MKYLLLRDEQNIHDVADKAYKNLSAEARDQAEAALLKANPELKTFRSVDKGFIVRVPAVHNVGKKDRKNLVNPIEDIAQEMLENLKLLENSLTNKFANLDNRQKAIVENLKAASKELKKQPNGEAVAKALKKHVADSKPLNDKNKRLGLEALKKLQKTAENFER